MANGPRTIYSRRQRLAPGQYDTPFADFLDNLPGYVNQFQQNQLALGQQQFQQNKYANDTLRQIRIDRQNKEHQDYRDELESIKLLPESLRPEAYATSKIPTIKSMGEKTKQASQNFANLLRPIDKDWVDNPSGEIEYLEGLLEDPTISPYPKRIEQIEDRIGRLKPKLIRKQINTWAQKNPDDPRVEAIVIQSKTDPDGALRALTPARTTISTNQERVYNPFTKEFGFATDAEIAKAKATETKEDDLIPTSGAPKQGGKEQSLTQINERIDNITKRLRRKDVLTPKEIDRLNKALRAWEIKADELSAIKLPSSPTLKLPLQTATQESTKTIPGW